MSQFTETVIRRKVVLSCFFPLNTRQDDKRGTQGSTAAVNSELCSLRTNSKFVLWCVPAYTMVCM